MSAKTVPAAATFHSIDHNRWPCLHQARHAVLDLRQPVDFTRMDRMDREARLLIAGNAILNRVALRLLQQITEIDLERLTPTNSGLDMLYADGDLPLEAPHV